MARFTHVHAMNLVILKLVFLGSCCKQPCQPQDSGPIPRLARCQELAKVDTTSTVSTPSLQLFVPVAIVMNLSLPHARDLMVPISVSVNFDHFQILRAIGKGSFGKVSPLV